MYVLATKDLAAQVREFALILPSLVGRRVCATYHDGRRWRDVVGRLESAGDAVLTVRTDREPVRQHIIAYSSLRHVKELTANAGKPTS